MLFKINISNIKVIMRYPFRIIRRTAKTLVFSPLLNIKIFLTRNNIIHPYGKDLLTGSSGNEKILKLLKEKGPFMATRIGSSELSCIYFYSMHRNKKISYPGLVRNEMSILSGFFPNDDENLDRFSELFLERIEDTDIMGVWFNRGEDFICRHFCRGAAIIELRALEPYYYNNPWSRGLAKKKVLVIHPFADSIISQYNNNRNLLFENKNMLPDFELITLKAVQSYGNIQTGFQNWFDALHDMEQKISSMDFDVAIIGAGAYGLPLASFIKRLGKAAIHMGGATQILFGIKGSRWDNHRVISELYNKYWVRPSDSETPVYYKNIDHGCYW